MLGLLNTVLSRGGSLLTYVKDGLVMANRFLTPPKLTFPAQGSAEFNGSSDFINVTPSPIGAESAVSFSGWINTTQSFSSVKGIMSKGTNGFGDFVIAGRSTNKLGVYFQTNSASGGYHLSTTSINDGEWHFFAVTWENSSDNLKIYIDGSLENTQTIAGDSVKNTDTKLAIGAYSNETNFLDGNLANVAIWNRALSSDEINSVMWKSYEALSGTESNGLQAWYSLDDITSPAASLANMEQLATDKDATIENKAAITAAINALS